MSKNANTSALIIGFAMFAVFFGAGNLVFPPLIGLMSGSSWGIAILGLTISAILFPIATIIAVDNMGGTIQSICAPVASWFTRGYMVMWIIFILTCGVPRQAGVGIESGLLSVFPSLQGNDMLRIALLAVLQPLGTPMAPQVDNVFSYSFLQGYQTGDVAVGIAIAGMFIASIKARGYTDPALRH